MIIPYKNTGSIGIITDVHPTELSPDAWSGGINVACKDGSIERCNAPAATEYGTPTAIPTGITYAQNGGANWWLYGTATALYSVNGTTHTDVKSAAYTDGGKWHFAHLGAGVVVANNQVNDPQLWAVSASACVDLTNWPATTTCKCMRSLRSHLIAMDVTESGTRYENKLRWSTAAPVGAIPASWAESDPTVTSGSTNIGSDSPLIDMLPLGETGIIYKAGDCWTMNYIGGQYIWDFSQSFSELGMLALGCGVELKNSHIILTSEDVVQTNGIEANSIIEGRLKNFLFREIDATHYGKTFMLKNEFRKEIAIYFVSSGAASISNALIWDYAHNTWTIKEMPNVLCGASGVADGTYVPTYASSTDTYDSATSTYHAAKYSPTTSRILLGTADTTLLMDDAAKPSSLAFCEKTSMSMDLPQNYKLVKSIRPKFDAYPGTVLSVMVGTQDDSDGPISWTTQQFTVGTDFKADFLKSGRYISVRFQSAATETNHWRLNSFAIDVEPQGEF